jgi:hypothetical protein
VVWIPLHAPGSAREEMNFSRDVIEVADGIIKLKDFGRRMNISARIAVSKVWLPKDAKNQDLALELQRLNLALDILAFHWIQCRCIDLSKLTMEPWDKKDPLSDETRIEVPGFENSRYQPRNFKNMISDPMEISFFSGRRAREIIRKVLSKYGVEPNWEKALEAKDMFEKVSRPFMMTGFYGTRKYEFPEPAGGSVAANKAMKTRVKNRAAYEQGASEDNSLPDTYLDIYPWVVCNVQHKDWDHPGRPYKSEPVSEGNTILSLTAGSRRFALAAISQAEEVVEEIVPDRQVSLEKKDVVNITVTKTWGPSPLAVRGAAKSRLGGKVPEPDQSKDIDTTLELVLSDTEFEEMVKANRSVDSVEMLDEVPSPGARAVSPEKSKVPAIHPGTPCKVPDETQENSRSEAGKRILSPEKEKCSKIKKKTSKSRVPEPESSSSESSDEAEDETGSETDSSSSSSSSSEDELAKFEKFQMLWAMFEKAEKNKKKKKAKRDKKKSSRK